MQLTIHQQKALDILIRWYFSDKRTPFITLGGYAGTGKTTLISIYREELAKKKASVRVAFCAYTGKAAQVLRTKLQQSNSVKSQDSIGTIHSLMYAAVKNRDDEIIGWSRKDALDVDLIIVDEASMVDELIWQDMLLYNIPIIAVGDHGQLPPIRGSFNLMEKPLLRLEEIVRQAKESPIIQLSIDAREKGRIEPGDYGYNVRKLARSDSDTQEIAGELLKQYKPDTLILCGYNTTRIKLNGFIRDHLEFSSSKPQAGDRVICLKNNRTKQIYNGMIGTIKKIKDIDEDTYKAEIYMDDGLEYEGLIMAKQFNSNGTDQFVKIPKGYDLFDYGYALTVHKAQGSQAKRVLLFEERFKQMDDASWKRWLYTAVTRAEEELFIVGD